jgi:hypothetical protein
MNLNKEKIKENWPEINRRLKAKYRNLEDQDLTFKEDWDAELLRASSESRIQQISKSREVHDKNCNGDPC